MFTLSGGAGKTESQKYVLRYLCENWGSHAGPIEQRILESEEIPLSLYNITIGQVRCDLQNDFSSQSHSGGVRQCQNDQK